MLLGLLLLLLLLRLLLLLVGLTFVRGAARRKLLHFLWFRLGP